MTIGQILRMLREEVNKKQVDVSKDLKITTQAYSQYERDVRVPDVLMLKKLADYFFVTTDYLLGRTNHRNEYVHQNHSVVFESVGERIANLRKENQLTIQNLADRCNISKSYVNDIEKGRVNPSLDTLRLIAEALNTTMAYLAGEDSTNSDKRENLASLSGDEIPEKLRDAGVGFIKLKEYIKKEGIPEEDVIKILEAIKQMKK